jgi:hypothetical protein
LPFWREVQFFLEAASLFVAMVSSESVPYFDPATKLKPFQALVRWLCGAIMRQLAG